MNKLNFIFAIIIACLSFASCEKPMNDSLKESNIIGMWKCIQDEGWECIGNTNNKEYWDYKEGDDDWDDDDCLTFLNNHTGLWSNGYDGEQFEHFTWQMLNNKFKFTFEDIDCNENNWDVTYLSQKLLVIEITWEDKFYEKLSFIRN